MSTPYFLNRDSGGVSAYAPQPSTDLYSATLTTGSAASVTVPSNFPYWVISFGYEDGSNVWVSFTTTAAVPAGATFASTQSTFKPGSRTVKAGTVISLITPDTTAQVGIELYAKQTP